MLGLCRGHFDLHRQKLPRPCRYRMRGVRGGFSSRTLCRRSLSGLPPRGLLRVCRQPQLLSVQSRLLVSGQSIVLRSVSAWHLLRGQRVCAVPALRAGLCCHCTGPQVADVLEMSLECLHALTTAKEKEGERDRERERERERRTDGQTDRRTDGTCVYIYTHPVSTPDCGVYVQRVRAVPGRLLDPRGREMSRGKRHQLLHAAQCCDYCRPERWLGLPRLRPRLLAGRPCCNRRGWSLG